jgi:hypothetical protein
MKKIIQSIQCTVTAGWDRGITFLRAPYLRYAVLMFAALFMQQTMAADFDLPKVDAISGLDGKKDPMSMIAIIIKYAVRVLLWLAVIAGAVVLIKNTVKEINKVRRDEDGKWGAVVGEIIGNIIALLAIIAFATWLNSLIA